MKNEQSYTLKDLFQDTSRDEDDRSFATDSIEDGISRLRHPLKRQRKQGMTGR